MYAALANHLHLHIIGDLIEMNGNNMYSNKLYTVHAPLIAMAFIFLPHFLLPLILQKSYVLKKEIIL